MANEIFRLEFERVTPFGRNGQFYNGDRPICRPEEVPDWAWSKTVKDTDSPWQQYNQLKAWAKSGEELIRNVKLFKAVTVPQWVLVDDPPNAEAHASATKEPIA